MDRYRIERERERWKEESLLVWLRLTLQLGHNSEDKGNFKCGVSSKNLLLVKISVLILISIVLKRNKNNRGHGC